MWGTSLTNDVALFLDVDGTLLELAPTAHEVHVFPELPEVLDELAVRLDGALALISGRQIDRIDRLFSPYRFCAAGVHGCELRYPCGLLHRAVVDAHIVEMLHEECSIFASNASGLMVEYKAFGVAIHYRLAPEMERSIHRLMHALVARLSSDFIVQPGKFVCEIRPARYSKGTAILELARSPPFRGRRPAFIGGDVADEDSFRVVNSLGGMTIRVGKDTQSQAQRRLRGPPEVHRLLARLLLRLGTSSALS